MSWFRFAAYRRGLLLFAFGCALATGLADGWIHTAMELLIAAFGGLEVLHLWADRRTLDRILNDEGLSVGPCIVCGGRVSRPLNAGIYHEGQHIHDGCLCDLDTSSSGTD
ncbi:hypothetical protein LCGC14_3058960, partial [marine sediment metagenome]